MKSKTRSNTPQAKQTETISNQIERNKRDGYKVLPSQLLAGTSVYNDLYRNEDILNFASLSPKGSAYEAACGCSQTTATESIAFTSCGVEEKVNDCGDPDLGYIPWGANNMLPNIIALANSMLPYTAEAIEFNVKVAVGLGICPIYKHPGLGSTEGDDNPIPYSAAGSVINDRIITLQQKIFELTKDHTAIDTTADGGAGAPTPSSTVQSASASATIPSHPWLAPTSQTTATDEDDEDEIQPVEPKQKPRTADYFKRIADNFLDDTIARYTEEINSLKRDYAIWKRTNKQLVEFMRMCDSTVLMQRIAADRISYGLAFPEICLDIRGNSRRNKDNQNGQWLPKIVSIGHRNALTCRLERHDIEGVSRHIYLSNHWLSPQDRYIDDNEVPGSSSTYKKITALPAIDPLHPSYDLEQKIRKFRIDQQRDHDERQAASGSNPVYDDITLRPTRFILPVGLYTAGRGYYPIPAFWSIYADVYQYASTIIRDRAIRKANENMFGRIIYVHAEYLEKLTNQLNAQETEQQKQAIKDAEIAKIQQFLSNKFNNGQTFATCTFIDSQGNNADAFRVETIPYNNKTESEANRTEIQDISGIILFTLECHPDLIGATPGGSSSTGGTYQREMMLLKQSLMALVQHDMLAPYFLARDFNGWDSHLSFVIEQKTLTTLDRNHSGWENARK